MTLDRRVRVAVALLLAVAAGAWLVTNTAWLPSADLRVNQWVAEHRPGWLVDAARAVTELGWFAVLLPLTLGAGVVVAVAGGWRDAWRPAATLLVAAYANAWIKDLIGRPRPEGDLWAAFAPGFGYPSGHSAQAAAAWLGLALVLAARWPARRRLVLAFGLAIAGLVGASRVILGVHSPTDVLAGWALGAAVALVLAPRRR